MSIVIGIDVGISTTKIVGVDEHGIVVNPFRIKATDPITSLYGAFGKYLHDNKIKLDDVEKIMLTGVGSAYIDENIYGRPTSKAQEFIADGLGARYESKLKRMIVVSMGTGTSLVKYMVLQAVGSSTILSSLESGIKDFVLIGNLTLLPQCKEVFHAMEKLYGVHFRIPKYSEFCTAIGAALCYIQNR